MSYKLQSFMCRRIPMIETNAISFIDLLSNFRIWIGWRCDEVCQQYLASNCCHLHKRTFQFENLANSTRLLCRSWREVRVWVYSRFALAVCFRTSLRSLEAPHSGVHNMKSRKANRGKRANFYTNQQILELEQFKLKRFEVLGSALKCLEELGDAWRCLETLRRLFD